MLQTSIGNDKLGKKVVIVNRAVGDSCPSSCWFLGNGCYAEKTENRFKASRAVGQRNMGHSRKVYRLSFTTILMMAYNSGMDVRMHERGDFLENGKIDENYLRGLQDALRDARDSGFMPKVWVYTHVLHKRISGLSRYGVNVYASVKPEQIAEAKRAGFTLFAIDSGIKHRKGGTPDAPKYINFGDHRALVCPEQRLGRKRVTCCGTTGKRNTTACKWCTTGKGHVAFLSH